MGRIQFVSADYLHFRAKIDDDWLVSFSQRNEFLRFNWTWCTKFTSRASKIESKSCQGLSLPESPTRRGTSHESLFRREIRRRSFLRRRTCGNSRGSIRAWPWKTTRPHSSKTKTKKEMTSWSINNHETLLAFFFRGGIASAVWEENILALLLGWDGKTSLYV